MAAGACSTYPHGGMFVWLALPDGMNAEELFPLALEEKVAFVPGSGFFALEKRREFMRLNFSNLRPEMIEEGLGRLGRVTAKAFAGWHAGVRPAVSEVRL